MAAAQQHHGVLDPQLDSTGSSTGLTSPLQPPPLPSSSAASSRFMSLPRPGSTKSDTGPYGTQSSPQPYYQYPSPQTRTPSQHAGFQSARQSSLPSPTDMAIHHAGEDDASLDQAGDDPLADDPKRARACESCRGLKVRCDQDPAHPEIPCKRCAKAGRPCIITQSSRKRHKKSDSRVAELEKKLDALTAALHHQQQHPVHPAAPASQPLPDDGFGRPSNGYIPLPSYIPPPTNNSAPLKRSASEELGPGSKRRRSDQNEPSETPTVDGAGVVVEPALSRGLSSSSVPTTKPNGSCAGWGSSPDLRRYLSYQNPDEFAKRINSLISPDLAATIFNRYTKELCPHLPAVVFPTGTTAEQVFKEKPILYVCILSAASSGTLHTDTAREINREAIGAIADCVVRSGAKSLELIQAMQVIALWYKPPEQAEATNFYQVVHMAAVMALDIGLGKRFNPAKARRGFGGPNANFAPGPGKTLPQDSDTLEARRAWLCCYFLCASASMVLRRPNLIRWTAYMKECIEVLESHPDCAPSDRLFCQYIKIQHICEDIGLQFLMDDNTATISIKDPKVTYALNVLEGQLKTWKEEIPPDCRTTGLRFFEHVTSLYLHEIALHFNHNIDDFRLPFTEESLKSVNSTSDTLTQSQMAALEACLAGAHGILDTLMTFEVHAINSLPMLIYFVRCVYAIVILIKMHVAVSTPKSELGKMMNPEDLRVDHYLDSLIRLFSFVLKKEGSAPHPKILRILNVLRDWFGKHKQHVSSQSRGEQPQALSQSQQPVGQDRRNFEQTPLHLLSQVATDNQQITSPRERSTNAARTHDWTFNNPAMVDYSHRPRGYESSLPPSDQSNNSREQPSGYPSTDAYGLPIDPGMVDPSNPDGGWGTCFEQAMDLALGGMDGLHGAGLDNWFLGDSVAPFGFQGDVTPAGTWQ